jgi:hypothetical protein
MITIIGYKALPEGKKRFVCQGFPRTAEDLFQTYRLYMKDETVDQIVLVDLESRPTKHIVHQKPGHPLCD